MDVESTTPSEGGNSRADESKVTTRRLPPCPIALPWLHYGLDVVAVFVLFTTLQVLGRRVGSHESGFYCDDKTIRLPYRDSTVGFWGLMGYCGLINFFTILAVEFFRLYFRDDPEYSRWEVYRPRWQRLIIRFAIFFGFYYSFELFIAAFTTITKLSVGRLRPHFLDVCRPKVMIAGLNPTVLTPMSSCAGLEGIFIDISNYVCTTRNAELVLEARKSFFSGHSSLSMGASTFAVLFMQFRLVDQVGCRLVVPVLQICVLGGGLFISYSRIFDYKHHWTDVAVGMFVGIVGMFLMCRYVARFFHPTVVQLLPSGGTQSNRDSNHTASTALEVPSRKRSFEWSEQYA